MNNNPNFKLYFHTLIGFIALTIGYPKGGSVFILVMIPYLIYMVLNCDAVFLPALILHNGSETSASTVVCICFILLMLWKYKEIVRLKLGLLFWVLILVLPIFIWLVWQRIYQIGDYPPFAFSYISYYLSFFAFFYGVLIAKTITNQILNTILISLVILYFLYQTDLIYFPRIVVAFNFLSFSIIALFVKNKNPTLFLLVISIFGISAFMLNSEISTFTTLFVCVFSFLYTYFYLSNLKEWVINATGYLPFLLIFCLLGYGINNYMIAEISSDAVGVDIFNWQNLKNGISYKFFGDRAEYWSGGFYQILEFKHVLPIPDMPDLTAVSIYNVEREISFGSHTVFIELVRKYGILAGVVLSICLIYIVIISRKIFSVSHLPPLFVAFISMAFATTIILSLTGHFHILPGYALLSLGVIGIAYSKYLSTQKIKL